MCVDDVADSQRVLSAFLTLLRAGLWERDVDNPGMFPLSPAEWRHVYDMSFGQTVRGIIYQGLCQLPEEMLPPEELLLRWVAEVDAIERRNGVMNDVAGELSAFFRKEGLRPVLLKGQGVAGLYAHPLLRECGDIDLYFPEQGHFERAAAAAVRRGVSAACDADGCLHYQWRGITVEHHRRFSDMASPARRRVLLSCERSKGFVPFALSSVGAEVEVPSPFLNLLLLNTHILKHSLGWGIGFRQLCDMALACHVQSASADSDEYATVIRRLGLSRWTRMLHAFLTTYLGLPASSLPCDTRPLSPLSLLNLVVAGGNFGKNNRPDKGMADCSLWRRKAATALALSKRAGFSLRYAPDEAVWTFFSLLLGQKNKTPRSYNPSTSPRQ